MDAQKKLAFVALPFKYPYIPDHFDNILRPALDEAGFAAEKADDIYCTGLIIDQIKSYIARADLILCELTGRNANVLYELGLANALGKPAIVITQEEGDVPFDLRHRPYLRYNPMTRGWQRELRNRITTAARLVASAGSDERPLYTNLPPDDIRVATGTHNRQMYTIIGLKPEEPVTSAVFQSFQVHPEENRNPIASLWADPQLDSRIAATVSKENGAPVLRVSFSNQEGTLSPSVGIHPEGLIAKLVPKEATKLVFHANLPAGRATSDVAGVSIAVRVANGHAEHWTYRDRNTNGLAKFKVPNRPGPPLEVDLRTARRWELFYGAGNHAAFPAMADFRVVTCVVFEFGCGGSARELGHGDGEVEIGAIRFE